MQRVPISGGNAAQMRETLRQIGTAIRKGSIYPPIRNYAAAIATKAEPKNFLGQIRAVYDNFVKNWRYVKDPARKELLTASPEAMFRLTMGGDGIGVGLGKGAGDCDCASAALGAQLEAIGFKTRLATTSDRNAPPGNLFGHVFVQTLAPGLGWVTVDPVLHPKRKFGAVANHSRIAFWDLDGNLLDYKGNFTGLGDSQEVSMKNIENWQDVGLAGITDEDGQEPIDWSMLGLSDWGFINTPKGKISAVESWGLIDGGQLHGLCAEVDENDDWEPGIVRTPMLELALDDYQHVVANGQPYDGMLGLGDTGELYYYDGSLGFFKKLRRRIRKKVRKVARRIKRGVKKVLKKSRFGRMLLKVGARIKKIAMKLVRPLVKFVGKYAAKLAPIAALIPGFGPAVAGGLLVAGKIAKTMQKFGVRTVGKKGKVRSLKLKDPRKLKAFRRSLRRQAKRMQSWGRRNPAKFKRISRRLAR